MSTYNDDSFNEDYCDPGNRLRDKIACCGHCEHFKYDGKGVWGECTLNRGFNLVRGNVCKDFKGRASK